MFESITEICREVPDHLRCRHILDEGHRCGSYALRNEHFCYYHHADRKPVPDPQARYARRNTLTLSAPTSRAAIQEAIGKIIISLASNDIDRRRAGLLLYGLQLAALNIARHQQNRKDDTPNTASADPAPNHTSPNSTPNHTSPNPPSTHVISTEARSAQWRDPCISSSPAANAPVPDHHNDPENNPTAAAPEDQTFTEEVFPLPQPKLYPLPRAGAALLLRSLAEHLKVQPSPGTPEDRRTEPAAPEATESILYAVSAVAVVSNLPPPATSSRPKRAARSGETPVFLPQPVIAPSAEAAALHSHTFIPTPPPCNFRAGISTSRGATITTREAATDCRLSASKRESKQSCFRRMD